VRLIGEKGLAPKTIANVHGLLSAAMTTAVRLGYRADNPCVGVVLPKSVATRDEMTVLTRDEFALLLSKVSGFYQPLVLTLVATGLRWGEATALTAGDVDLDARPATLRVTKAWKRDADRHWYVGPPKTKRARRTVSLPDELVDVLLPLVAAMRRTSCCSRTRSGSSSHPRGSGRRRGRPHLMPPANRSSLTALPTPTPLGSRNVPVCTTSATRTRRG
jgi:integrase